MGTYQSAVQGGTKGGIKGGRALKMTLVCPELSFWSITGTYVFIANQVSLIFFHSTYKQINR